MANPMLNTRRFGGIVQTGRYTVPVVDAKSKAGVLANFAGVGSALAKATPPEVRRVTEATRRTAESEAPVSAGRSTSGTLRGAHVTRYSKGGLVGTVEVDPGVFAVLGLTYYAPFVHNGTARMPANPWLRRAFERNNRPFQRRMVKASRSALRRRFGG